MKKIIIILLAAISFVSCKKNNDDITANPADISNKVKKSIYGSGSTTYVYDGMGRVKTQTYMNGSRTEFEYQPGKVLEKTYDPAGLLTLTYTYELNANGFAEKETRSNEPSFQEIRVYNNDGQVQKFTVLQNGSSSTGDFFYSNGNCDSARYSTNGNWNSTVKKTYYTDKPNMLGYEQFGESFWGKKNKNLQKSEQYFYTDGSAGNLESYSYEFDAKGRVTKQTSVVDNDIYITFLSY